MSVYTFQVFLPMASKELICTKLNISMQMSNNIITVLTPYKQHYNSVNTLQNLLFTQYRLLPYLLPRFFIFADFFFLSATLNCAFLGILEPLEELAPPEAPVPPGFLIAIFSSISSPSNPCSANIDRNVMINWS